MNVNSLITSVIFSVLGMIVLVLGFFIFDRLTPYHLWKQIVEERNVALAIVIGAVSLGFSIIIASSVHG